MINSILSTFQQIHFFLPHFFSVSHFATADEFTDTTLRVITIEKRQYGYYSCKAINKLGAAEAKVHLFGKLHLADDNSALEFMSASSFLTGFL